MHYTLGNNTYFISENWLHVLLLLAVWSVIWKGIALWKAGRNNQLAWFVVMLIVNSIGILEIIYILFFARKQKNIK